MKLHIFSIHDSKASAFITPIFAQTIPVALRMFHRACNDQESDISRYAADYTLFELGTFDQDEGRFELHDTHINHGLALTFIDEQQPENVPSVKTAVASITREDALRNIKEA